MPPYMHTLRPPLCVATAAVAVSTFIPAARAGTQDLQPQFVVGVRLLESQLITAVNTFRAARGQRPFRVSARLHAAAVRHSSEMARYGYFAHASPNGGAFWRRIAAYYSPLGYRSWEVGENMEYGQPGLAAAEVLREWLASPPHRANIVSTRWRDAGIGAVSATGAPGVYGGLPTTIVTLDLGRRRR
jgi:uncharacterized protein YkwD